MRYELKSMSLWAFLKVSFFVFLIGGFLIGFVYAVILLFISGLTAGLGGPQEDMFLFEETGVGLMFIILPIGMSLVLSMVYTVIGVIFVILYNLIARMVGGFEIDLEPVDVTPVPTNDSGPMYAQTGPASPPPPPPPSSTPPEGGAPPSQPT